MISTADVIAAYRLILGREPENTAVIEEHIRSTSDFAALRSKFLSSEEFRNRRVPDLPPRLDMSGPIRVQTDAGPEVLEKLFRRVEQTWEALGRTEPHWSVLSADCYRAANFSAHQADYYQSGTKDAARLDAWLRRNGIADLPAPGTCCEYGCGTGRVTYWLASRFSRVIACDISLPHLDLAAAHLARSHIRNVTLRHIDRPDVLARMEPVDLVFSFQVLQHNPPPLIAYTLEQMLGCLLPGGIAFFQVPTYTPGYEFHTDSYLRMPVSGEIELHAIPQQCVFEIARRSGCSVLEMQPDDALGLSNWISNTFLLQKPL